MLPSGKDRGADPGGMPCWEARDGRASGEARAQASRGGKEGKLRPGPSRPGSRIGRWKGRLQLQKDFVCFTKASFSGFLLSTERKAVFTHILVCAHLDSPRAQITHFAVCLRNPS